MARKARVRARSGVYHVVMQGVRYRDIFLDDEDYGIFVELLRKTRTSEDEEGGTLINYELYAYCLMNDHLHLLLKEGRESVSKVVGRIATAYSHYFNNKYDRDGAVYRARFASEPVEDESRLSVVLRYIIQAPTRLNRVEDLDDYEYSSWREYMGLVAADKCICTVREEYRRLSQEELRRMLEAPLQRSESCLGPRRNPIRRPSDKQVLVMIHELTGASSISEFMLQPYASCLLTLTDLRKKGASVRQLERLTGINRGIIQRL
ncbi:MAG: transposase [Prevotella sp.]|nr:transposase [Prevotella sp.]